jgi:putative serine protease PepD
MPGNRPAADDVRDLPRQHRTMPQTTTRRRRRAAAATAVVAMTAALLAGCGDTVAPPATVLPASGSAAALQKEFTDVVARVSPTVVQIQTTQGLGSGIVYDADGNVVTNAHVTSGATRFVVTLMNGDRHAARLVGADRGNDLAVIHITGGTPEPARFADSSKVRAGDISFAIGNPLGLRSSVTQGIVSSVSRNVSEGNGVTLSQAIQTSAEINPGNSGGALVDLSGRVIGIPTLAGLDPEFGDTQAPGIGFAIPSSTVQRVANELIGRGTDVSD